MHISVLLQEVVEARAVRPGGVYVDGTLGRAGHACAVMARAGASARLIGIDRDRQALRESAEKLKALASQVTVLHGRHGDVARLVREAGVDAVDGVLLDLGVSSPQLDEAARGFSFRADGPLDMRMDDTCGETAADVVATWGEEALAEMLRTLGEEPAARRIARAIVRARETERLTSTLQLAALVERTVGRHGAHHPATRTFQALRMTVNDELGELTRALEGGLSILKPGGRFAVISFESLSDRLVKRFFAAHAGREVSLQQGGTRWEGARPRVRLVTRRAVTASAEEVAANPRARSAKLRVAERLQDEEGGDLS